eukprot:gene17784-18003_t
MCSINVISRRGDARRRLRTAAPGKGAAGGRQAARSAARTKVFRTMGQVVKLGAIRAAGLLPNYVAGQWVVTDRRFDNIDPTTGAVIGSVCEAGKAEIDAAVAAARRALEGPWGSMPAAQRIALLHAIADRITARFDDFVEAETRDTGMPIHFAEHVNVPRGAANFKLFADLFANVPTESFAMDTHDGGKALNYGLRETPSSANLLAEVMAEVGLPEGVFNVIHGHGADAAGQWLTEHPGVDGITFTGETATGEAIMRAAAKGVRPVSFEMGGKNSAIVFADADLDEAVAGLARSVFQNTGQVCLGTEKIYVQRPVFDEVVARLTAVARALRPGRPGEDGADFGPLNSRSHQDKVLSYYALARAEGATVVTGGGVPAMPAHLAGGWWIEPTIWTGLGDHARVVNEEIFGPCCHIAPFDTEAEVIGRANATRYGLAASVWTRDLATAHRMGAALQVGVCWINSWFLRDLRTAFGGAKQSGIGREGGVHSLEFYTELRNICVKI